MCTNLNAIMVRITRARVVDSREALTPMSTSCQDRVHLVQTARTRTTFLTRCHLATGPHIQYDHINILSERSYSRRRAFTGTPQVRLHGGRAQRMRPSTAFLTEISIQEVSQDNDISESERSTETYLLSDRANHSTRDVPGVRNKWWLGGVTCYILNTQPLIFIS